jgi:hypothetical protein
MNQNQYSIRKVGHSKIRDHRVGGIYAAEFVFRKVRVLDAGNGNVAEFPFSESLYLLKLPGNQHLWIKPGQRRSIIDALERLSPIDVGDDKSAGDMQEAALAGNTSDGGVVA